jgi:hypothetical protein
MRGTLRCGFDDVSTTAVLAQCGPSEQLGKQRSAFLLARVVLVCGALLVSCGEHYPVFLAGGAVSISPSSGGCDAGPHVIPADGIPTSERVAGDRLSDGDGGRVECRVSKEGSGYRVHLSLTEGARSFLLDATLAPDVTEYLGTGSVEFHDPDDNDLVSGSCTVSVLANQEIGTGKAWGNFSCTTDGAVPGLACDFEGSFVAELCDD